jgi:hypothetical protein
MIALPVPKLADVYNEVPLGIINNTNKLFITQVNFSHRSTRLYLNGMRMKLGLDNDYLESSINEITFNQAPKIGDTIILDYGRF